MKMPFKLTTILIFSSCLFLVACSNSEEKNDNTTNDNRVERG
jgi:hypothetical protein